MKLTVFFLTIALLNTSQSRKAQADEYITIASTTSTQDTGLLGEILPNFTKSTGISVRVIAAGTGQAIKIAENGDADVLLVHHKESEEAFIAAGFGVKRYDLMYNDFVVIGPAQDPAKISGLKDVVKAFIKIASSKSIFLSRGDDSGTNKKENTIWSAGGIDINKYSGSWYRKTGSGMGATLNMAATMNGYTIADRGTWLSFKNKERLEILVEGDPRLHNSYGVILVNPKRHPHVKADAGRKLINWLISNEGQNAIKAFKINGEQLFKSNLE
ncbi:MAG: sulfate transporter [Magnetovibrio sp.]|nr:sulfate transporter [Magnetovibrio sp.]|tara:strand:+ start:1835 stop:2650 length:816 start_codon:yes stop_codon:yes gene_type:complete